MCRCRATSSRVRHVVITNCIKIRSEALGFPCLWTDDLFFFYWRAPQQMLQTHRNLEGLLCNTAMKMIKLFLLFHFNGAPVEWNWQGIAEVLGEKPLPVPFCPPQIPHRPTRDRNRASAVRGRRLTAWSMARLRVAGYLDVKSVDNQTESMVI
jgi:hypothetical protein